ncbi:MAG: CehA/McbA family metallohydrolase [Verrucomicrobia bacterium]|nr:CehA/McbA family metallohydrolase [Verrucomicrobiota bacterium]
MGAIAVAARTEGALLDLDKHDWPWSMALVPVMGVDLFELANNHHWRTTFALTNWSTPAPAWMNLPNQGRNGNERDWTLYGFQNYYALLNCGFRLRPTAGTASGVHPVPLGFSRVYVHLPDGFRYDDWIEGLDAGRSFVTTGPMLFATVNGHPPGYRTESTAGSRAALRVAGEVLSERPLEAIELVVNGEVVRRLEPHAVIDAHGAWDSRFEEVWSGEGSAWVAVRCWEPREQGRVRFAHTAPWFFDVAGAPVRPRRTEVEFLVQRVRDEIERSAGVLPAEALAEYRQALIAYEGLLRRAVP